MSSSVEYYVFVSFFRITVTDTDTSVSSVSKDAITPPERQRKRNTSQNNKNMEFKSMPSTPDNVSITSESNKKFWPPSPKLRAASSMVNLTDLDSSETNNNNVEQRSKKPKWYKQLSHTLKLTPQSLKLSGSESNLSKEKDKSKKKFWRKMKLASHS